MPLPPSTTIMMAVPELAPAEQIRRHVAVDGAEQRAGVAADGAGDDEAHELVGVGVEAERAHAHLVEAHALQHAAERRAREPDQQKIARHQRRQAEVIKVDPVAEVEKLPGADGDHRLDVDVGAVGAAGEAGVVKEREQHLAEGERHHDEIEAARQHHDGADECGGGAGDEEGGRIGEQRIRRFRLGRDEIKHVGAEPEEHGVAEADEAGDADEEIEADHQDRDHHDAGGELHPVGADQERQHQRECEQRDQQQHNGKARPLQHHARPNRPPGRVISTAAIRA